MSTDRKSLFRKEALQALRDDQFGAPIYLPRWRLASFWFLLGLLFLSFGLTVSKVAIPVKLDAVGVVVFDYKTAEIRSEYDGFLYSSPPLVGRNYGIGERIATVLHEKHFPENNYFDASRYLSLRVKQDEAMSALRRLEKARSNSSTNNSTASNLSLLTNSPEVLLDQAIRQQQKDLRVLNSDLKRSETPDEWNALSPINGVVISSPKGVGQRVKRLDLLASLKEAERSLLIKAYIHPNDIALLDAHDTVNIKFSGKGNRSFAVLAGVISVTPNLDFRIYPNGVQSETPAYVITLQPLAKEGASVNFNILFYEYMNNPSLINIEVGKVQLLNLILSKDNENSNFF